MKINNLKKQTANLVLALCLTSALVGCSSIQSASNDAKDVLVAPAPNAGFIQQPERDTKIAYLPFQRAWIDPNFNKSNYTQLVVAPVNTNYMLEMDWLHQLSSASVLSDVKNDMPKIAQYFHDQIVKEFNEDPNHRFQIIDSVAQRTAPALRLEIALVEVDPSMPMLHAAGWAVVGGGAAANVINQRKAAFEGRLRDLQTNKIVATFADRNMQDVAPLDLTNLTWYGPAKGIMDGWAKEFVAVANRKPGEKVSSPTAFTLRPF
ncbi:hypothetical protein BCS42_13390 [Crenothrix sp. D3]|nr:hypothetical protein BCS42_13390 [Crenothrix sp. D3]